MNYSMRTKVLPLLILCLVSFGLQAQRSGLDQESDSLENERRERYIKWKAKRDSIRKVEIREALNVEDLLVVEYLNLSGGGYDKVPEEIKQFKNLKRLSISENGINHLPGWLFKKLNLQYLNISENSPKGKRFKFPKNHSVQEIILNNSNHSSFPRGLRRLKGLRSFSFNGNPVKEKKIKGKALINVRKLSMMQDTFPEGYSFLFKATHLHSLNLAKSDIKTFPSQILAMDSLKELVLAENRINKLPKELIGLQTLERLIMYKNGLEEYPRELYGFPQLVELDIYYNKIKYLPDGIEELRNLQKVYFSFNELYELPSGLMDCKDLRYVYAHHNHLTSIPKGISNLDSLKILDLNHNNIQFFSSELCRLTKLEELDLSFNSIEDLDGCLLGLPSLDRIFLQENSFDIESPEFSEVIRVLDGLARKGVFVQPQLRFSEEE